MGRISVNGLGKAYKQYEGRWARLAEWLPFSGAPRHRLKWVLQDISFEVSPGEAVGIVGINGAGKSTLLKMITGTTQPTAGSVNVTGRVAALLELGMGFHPDFTGRQNAIMAGQLLGYSVEEIARVMPAIEAFAEIGEYIDQPVRVYSSGMQMRLAFSVATAIRPDILIVDEALSVGDAYFQHKSFDRIRDYGLQGTTLLIVSHDKGAIQGICDRDRLGQPVYGTNTHHLERKALAVRLGAKLVYRFRFPANLGVGTYSVAIALHTADTHLAQNFEWRDLALVFKVVNVDKADFVGVAWLPPEMEVTDE